MDAVSTLCMGKFRLCYMVADKGAYCFASLVSRTVININSMGGIYVVFSFFHIPRLFNKFASFLHRYKRVTRIPLRPSPPSIMVSYM